MFRTLVNTMFNTLLGLALAASLAGCNTVAGMGRDIEKAGETIQGAAKK